MIWGMAIASGLAAGAMWAIAFYMAWRVRVTEQQLLELLADGSATGLELCRRATAHGLRAPSPDLLYTALSRLEARGLVLAIEGTVHPGTGLRRRVYRLAP